MKKKRGTNNFSMGTNKKKKYPSPLIDPAALTDSDIETFKKFLLDKLEYNELDSSPSSRSSNHSKIQEDNKDPRFVATAAQAISSQLESEDSFKEQPDPFGIGSDNTTNQKQTSSCPCPLDNPPKKPKVNYRYCNFTNSELFYFISTLTPLELIIFYTIFAIALTFNLNLRERTILGALFVDVGFTINALVQQEAFQAAFAKDAQANKDREAYLTRQNNMATEIEVLKQKLESLTGTKITFPNEPSTSTAPENEADIPEAESEAIEDEEVGAIASEQAITTDFSSGSSALF